ncbi:hypothetical protein LUZ63_010623 [Rhynchospora breviuscula]|uniref:Glycosyltransferase 61 catalytic domain-containing protein n=1 Tax=Rhynchospora breviuscula TaxID=2022672 RepID=A0A9Q0CHG0_9POAL|nr:hypothetical protein LUZ63_010623 [Rhynchospora breviuscula]
MLSRSINVLRLDLSLPSWHFPSFHSSKIPNGFLPLKDLSRAKAPLEGTTWFMSSINDTFEAGEAEYLRFPSYQSEGQLLCLAGITFVSESHYGYDNICHGLFAVMPFAAWHYRKGCMRAARWVLYQRGELRKETSNWVTNLVELTFGEKMTVEKFQGAGEVNYKSSCFEEAVVFRHNEGKMLKEKKIQVYEMLRCKSREYCKIEERNGTQNLVKMTLLLRNGSRSFKDEAGVINVFRRECTKVKGCQLKVYLSENLTFCDQVKLMSETDILASPHGAQLTNLFFMDKNSSVMEFFPKGWKDLAGPGQFVFQWISAYSGMRHVGTWYDPKGDKCPYNDKSLCMTFYKNRQIGIDEHFISNWTSTVLKEERARKLHTLKIKRKPERKCKCS